MLELHQPEHAASSGVLLGGKGKRATCKVFQIIQLHPLGFRWSELVPRTHLIARSDDIFFLSDIPKWVHSFSIKGKQVLWGLREKGEAKHELRPGAAAAATAEGHQRGFLLLTLQENESLFTFLGKKCVELLDRSNWAPGLALASSPMTPM
ncbi:hypothetical protein CapIbe_003664 [Capra ibex]